MPHSAPPAPPPWPKSSWQSLLPVALTPPHSRAVMWFFPDSPTSLLPPKHFLSFLWYLHITVNKASHTSLQRKLLHFPLYPKLESPWRTHSFLLYPSLEANGWCSQTEELLVRAAPSHQFPSNRAVTLRLCYKSLLLLASLYFSLWFL